MQTNYVNHYVPENEWYTKEFKKMFDELLQASEDKKAELVNKLIGRYEYSVFMNEELRKGHQKVASMCKENKSLDEIKNVAISNAFLGHE